MNTEPHHPDDSELENIRATAEAILERARKDEAYKAELVQDPVATLVAAGLSDEAANKVGLDEWNYGDEPDTHGFMRRPRSGPMTCDGFTCWVTWCGLVPATNV